MRYQQLSCLVLLPCCFAAGGASATSLQVTPILLEVTSPGAATTVTLRNTEASPIATQIRVFRWIQEGGKERLEPTEDVVASPPAAELRPGQDYVVRIVRLTKNPVAGEEAYRLLIDELPEMSQRSRTVNFVMRHALPLFFDAPGSSAPEAAWSVTQKGRAVTLTATNAGDRRIRLASVKIGSGAKTVSFWPGLVGYALGHSAMSWTTGASGPGLPPGARATPFEGAGQLRAGRRGLSCRFARRYLPLRRGQADGRFHTRRCRPPAASLRSARQYATLAGHSVDSR